MKSFIILILFFLYTESCKAQDQQKDIGNKYNFFSIKTLWQIDSCGALGYRDTIVNYLKQSNYLIGKDSNYVRQLLGKPDFRIDSDSLNGISYTYSIECLEFSDKTCVKVDIEYCISWVNIFFDKNHIVKAIYKGVY